MSTELINSRKDFSGGEIEIIAENKNLNEVLSFVNSQLENSACSFKELTQINLAVEEIFVNISNYAYSPETGKARVRVELTEEPVTVLITFIDNGKPYDPLKAEDPDITLPVGKRQIGGLGVFLVKKTMDHVKYEYKDGCNILTLRKNL